MLWADGTVKFLLLVSKAIALKWRLNTVIESVKATFVLCGVFCLFCFLPHL